MNEKYTRQQQTLIKQALLSINESLTQQELIQDQGSPQWSIFKVLKILYYIVDSPCFTQQKCIRDLLKEFPNKTQGSMKELIKRVNSYYSKKEILKLAEEMKEYPLNINYNKAFQQAPVRKYERRLGQLTQGLIEPPEAQFERHSQEIIQKLNSFPIMGASDYSIQDIFKVFPQHKKNFRDNLARLQEFSHQTQESCVQRLVGCSLDLELAKRSFQQQRLMWDRSEDIQLIDSTRRKDDSEIAVFKMFKGEESLEKRKEFLNKLELSFMFHKSEPK